MLLIFGLAFMALGVLAGVLLLAGALGVAGLTAGLLLWWAFPLLAVSGFLLLVIPARVSQIRMAVLAVSGAMLALSLGAVVALMLRSASVMAGPMDGPALWFVAIVAGLLGVTGAAGLGRQAVSS